MNRELLIKFITQDKFGLLKIVPKNDQQKHIDSTLITNFKEINDFINTHGRTPYEHSDDIIEANLYGILSTILHRNDLIEKLLPFDEHGLFMVSEQELTLDDIFKNDRYGLLKDKQDSIFNMSHLPIKKQLPDYVAKRNQCKDFDQFSPLFVQCHKSLKAGIYHLEAFQTEREVQQGMFFLLKGMLVYVAQVGPKMIRNGISNARLRCIFENGTESDMLLRSLARRLYDGGGKLVASNIVHDMNQDVADDLNTDDVATGFIYIVKYNGNDPKISQIVDLYKIGFSVQPIEKRLANTRDDPTFLMSEVSVVKVYQAYNINPIHVERLLHRFFAKACLDIEIYDRMGRAIRPREWFVAPLPVIQQAVSLLLNREIVNYVYDHQRKIIQLRGGKEI